MLGFGILPSVAMFVSMCILFETPRWLVFHGKSEEARDVLNKIRNSDMVEDELSSIVREHKKSDQEKIGKTFTQDTLSLFKWIGHEINFNDANQIIMIFAQKIWFVITIKWQHIT